MEPRLPKQPQSQRTGRQKQTPERKHSELQVDPSLLGTELWVPSGDPATLFRLGFLQNWKGENAVCELDDGLEIFSRQHCRHANSRTDPLAIHDIARLPHTNDAAVLHHLKTRYINNFIYTYASKLLIAINPFTNIPHLYGPDIIAKYKKLNGDTVDGVPHTYAVAQKALSAFQKTNQNQSCVVSGESGAGKTETARQFMEFFSSVENHGYDRSTVSQTPPKSPHKSPSVQSIIMGSNPILESFGNAKTLRNNNSSRFGRFLKLGFHAGSQGIASGELSQYMLELSRIDTQQPGERNYHIFYQMCKALPANAKTKYKLQEMETYLFLNQSGTYDVDTVNDIEDHKELEAVLRKIMKEEELEGLYEALSGILLCGNIQFKDAVKLGTDRAAEVISDVELKNVATLFGIPAPSLEEAFTIKQTEIQNQIVRSAISATEALNVCRTLAKDAYATIFNWLVDIINVNIVGHHAPQKWIGILDIYGFEFFEKNSFEQFLINYANEKLQQFFVQSVFKAEQALYESEGLDASLVLYEDNAEIISLIESRKLSLLTLLDEQSLLGTGTSEKFTAACHQHFISNRFYEKPHLRAESTFGILHTAAPVTYTTTEFVTKNKLKMPNDLVNLMKASKNVSLKKAFSSVEPVEAGGRGKKFIASKFALSMEKLLDLLRSSEAHFVRCIKPNALKQPRNFHATEVLMQLQCLSVFEAVEIIRKGFAYRAPYKDFVEQHDILIKVLLPDTDHTKDPRNSVLQALKRLNLPEKTWAMGKTYIFLNKKAWMLLDQQLRKILQSVKPLIIRIQGVVQSHELRRKHRLRERTIVHLQALIRRYNEMKEQLKAKALTHLLFGAICLMKLAGLQKLQREAAITIQKHVKRFLVQKRFAKELSRIRQSRYDQALKRWVRGFQATRRWKAAISQIRFRKAALLIQRCWRGYKARQYARVYKKWLFLSRMAIRIQAAYRGYVARRKYRVMRVLNSYATTIQRHWRGYRVRYIRLSQTQQKRSKAIRRRLRVLQEERSQVLRLQNAARTACLQYRLRCLLQASLIVQRFAIPFILRNQLEAVRWATVTLQAWWRGDRTRRAIREEKLMLLARVDAIRTQKMTYSECNALLSFKQGHVQRGARHKLTTLQTLDPEDLGLQPIQVTIHTVPRTVYPLGWAQGLVRIKNDIEPGCAIVEIDCGAFHTVVATNSGHVYAYGLNDKNQLGLPNLAGLPSPIESLQFPLNRAHMETTVSIKQISCGADHTLLLTRDGCLFAWGSNNRGQCGTRPSQPQVERPTRVRCLDKRDSGAAGGHESPVMYISSGAFHCACVTNDEKVWLWGRRDHISIIGIINDVRTPRKLLDLLCLDEVKSDSDASDSSRCAPHDTSDSFILQAIEPAYRVECGVACTFVLNKTGKLFVLGNGRYTTCLGLGPGNACTRVPHLLPHPGDVVDIRVGKQCVLAVAENGKVWQWGTVLEWDPCISRSKKVILLTPMEINLNQITDTSPVTECTLGWWDAAVRTASGAAYGWTVYKHCQGSRLIPYLYQFDLVRKRRVGHIHAVSCPALTAVFCTLSNTRRSKLFVRSGTRRI